MQRLLARWKIAERVRSTRRKEPGLHAATAFRSRAVRNWGRMSNVGFGRRSNETRHLQHQQRQQAAAKPAGVVKSAKPDIVCLQELKAEQDAFPLAAIKKAGYHAAWVGQKSWNGVAILSKGSAPEVIRTRLPGDPQTVRAATSKRQSKAFLSDAFISRMAIRSRDRNSIISSLGLTVSSAMRELSRNRVPPSRSSATITLCPPISISTQPSPGTTMRCCSPKAALHISAC